MAEGTIYDLAYRRYEGGRTNPAWRFAVIVRYALRVQLRQRWVRLFLLGGLVVLAVAAAVLAVISMASSRVQGMDPRAAAMLTEVNVTAGSWGIWAQWVPTFLLLLICGAPAVSADLNAGAFQFYFARPIRMGQYLAGRLIAAGAWAALLSLASLAVFTLERVALGAPAGAMAMIALKALGPLLLRVLALSSVAVGLSSLTRRKGLAQAMFAATVLASWFLPRLVAVATHKTWIDGLGVTNSAELLGDQLLGRAHFTGWHAALPAATSAAWIVVFLGIATFRLARAEVVRG